MTAEKGIVLLYLQTFGGVLLVFHRGIAGCRFALLAGFRAFQRDNDASAFLCHDSDS